MQRSLLALSLAALLASCGGAEPSATGTPAPSPSPSTAPTASVPAPSETPQPTPTEFAVPIGVCPSQPPESTPVAPPFSVGSGYQMSLGDGGIDGLPKGLVQLTDWDIASPNGCIGEVLAFRFRTPAVAAAFSRDQAEALMGLMVEKVDGTTAWFSGDGGGARVAIGALALSIVLEPADPTTIRHLVRSILESTPPS